MKKLLKMGRLKKVIILIIIAHAILGLAQHFSSVLLTRYPQENLHLDYRYTVWVYGFYGAAGAVLTLCTSNAVDRLPAIPIVLIATVAGTLCRLALIIFEYVIDTRVHSPIINFFTLSFVMSATDTLTFLPLTLALKRVIAAKYANKTQSRAYFEQCININYIIGNAMDVVANSIYDQMRDRLGRQTANSLSIWLSMGAMFIGLLLVICIFRMVDIADRTLPDDTDDVACSRAIVKNPNFWRLMVMCLIFLGSRSVFRHLELTLPEYLERATGNRSRFPLVQSINPIVVVITGLTIILYTLYQNHKRGVLIKEIDVDENNHASYTLINIGTAFAAMGPLLIGLLLFLRVVPWLAASIGIFVFSVGEIMWSPQYLAYAYHVAPRGSEATFASLANIPSLLVKFPTSWLSIALFDNFCGNNAIGDPTKCDGTSLWSTIGLVAAITPILLIVFMRWLQTTTTKSSVY